MMHSKHFVEILWAHIGITTVDALMERWLMVVCVLMELMHYALLILPHSLSHGRATLWAMLGRYMGLQILQERSAWVGIYHPRNPTFPTILSLMMHYLLLLNT
ncbi:hypothetical protein ACFX16_023111 [Malus domestica]